MKLQQWLESVASPDAIVTLLRPRAGEWHATIWEPLKVPVKATGATLLDALQNLKERTQQ